MRTFSTRLTLAGMLLVLLLPSASAGHTLFEPRAPNLPDVNPPDTTEGTDEVVDRVMGSAWWVVRETKAFLRAVREEVHDCLDPHGPGC